MTAVTKNERVHHKMAVEREIHDGQNFDRGQKRMTVVRKKNDRSQNWTSVTENAHPCKALTVITENGDDHHKFTVVTENDHGHHEMTVVTKNVRGHRN